MAEEVAAAGAADAGLFEGLANAAAEKLGAGVLSDLGQGSVRTHHARGVCRTGTAVEPTRRQGAGRGGDS